MNDKEAKKDAKEKILMMAGLYGLTHNDLTSIGNRLRNQQRRNEQKAISDQLMGYQRAYDDKTKTWTVTHQGNVITAKLDGRKSTSYSKRWEVQVVGPRGKIKFNQMMSLDDYEIRDWPKKFMVDREFTLTCLLRRIQKGDIPL